jgi:hypothetical protein
MVFFFFVESELLDTYVYSSLKEARISHGNLPRISVLAIKSEL